MKKVLTGIALMAVLCMSCTPRMDRQSAEAVPTDSIIRINCMLSVKPEVRDAAIALSKELVEFSKKDVGNIDYDLFINASDSNRMMIFETWQDQSSLDIHSTAPHFTHIVPQLQSMGEMSIQVFKQAK